MLEDDKDRLWVGTWGAGLIVLPPDSSGGQKRRFISTEDSNSVAANSMNALVQDDRGYVWSGTQK